VISPSAGETQTGADPGVRGMPGESSPRRQWVTLLAADENAEAIARELDVPLVLARVLVGRGLESADDASRFLRPRLSDLSDPFIIPEMDLAVERIWRAIAEGERITVYGDYDVDGISGTALLCHVLKGLGGIVESFIPNRLTDGYGFTVGALTRCLEAQSPKLLITVDCGTGATEAVEFISGRGCEVVVTDHHEPSGRTPGVVADINPKLCQLESIRYLAGVGVAFKLSHALVKDGLEKERASASQIDLRDWLDLVALGTVADMVPLRDENRIVVRHGLMRLAETGLPGLQALKKSASVKGEIKGYHIGFALGPRLNAAGRLGSPDLALELLMTADPKRAGEIAEKLEKLNTERREIEGKVFEEACAHATVWMEKEKGFGLVLEGKNWHVGTIGIVASRLSGRFGRPAVVIAFDEAGRGRGSCRSIENVDILEILHECSDYLESFGGHRAAAGLDIKLEHMADFKKAFNKSCAKRLEGKDLRPLLNIDAWLPSLGHVDTGLFENIEQLRPFGLDNPAPVWGLRNLKIVGQPKVVGKNHLKMIVAGGGSQVEAIGFGMGEWAIPEGDIDVAFQVDKNAYWRDKRLQLKLNAGFPLVARASFGRVL